VWSGHAGTSNKRFRLNDREWIDVPEPAAIPGQVGRIETLPSSCYQYFIYPSINVPLEYLHEGENTLQFGADGQVCFDFGWGQWGAYGTTFRIYYDESKPHPTGQITAPVTNSAVGTEIALEANASSPNGAVQQVDFIGQYEDFDYEGNGVFRQWHYHYRLGRITHHLATATQAPYTATWNTAWVPDQDQPMQFMARIQDDAGVFFMTPVVDGITLERSETSVQLYKPYDIPPNWISRINQRHANKIFINHDLRRAKAAHMALATWSGLHASAVGINNIPVVNRVGQEHRYSFDIIPVPLDLLQYGINSLYTHSATSQHGIEVMWPGVALMVQYENSVEDALVPEDLVVFAERLKANWQVESQSTVLQEKLWDGRDALQLNAAGNWNIELQPVTPQAPFGYRALRFSFHPGTAGGPAPFNAFINNAGLQLGGERRDQVQKFISGRVVQLGNVANLGVDFSAATWQEVELPLQAMELSGAVEHIGFSGNQDGTFYLADLRLVATSGTAGTAVLQQDNTPQGFALEQNFPNPFNRGTVIRYALSHPVNVRLAVYNLSGQQVALLDQGPRQAGTYTVRWNGLDQAGRSMASGLYVYRLRAGPQTQTRKLLMIK